MIQRLKAKKRKKKDLVRGIIRICRNPLEISGCVEFIDGHRLQDAFKKIPLTAAYVGMILQFHEKCVPVCSCDNAQKCTSGHVCAVRPWPPWCHPVIVVVDYHVNYVAHRQNLACYDHKLKTQHRAGGK